MSTVVVSASALPVSRVSRWASSSLRSRRISTARRRMRERSMAVIAAHTFWPSAALCTARSTSAWLATCTSAIPSPVAGFTDLKVLPLVASTRWPWKYSCWTGRVVMGAYSLEGGGC
ncbi:hypothetical protein G6F61_014657 [Rhizopus arrhizus]|nr:hypothetical protein G6F61_014657 [Rhizopus arrhizus]